MYDLLHKLSRTLISFLTFKLHTKQEEHSFDRISSTTAEQPHYGNPARILIPGSGVTDPLQTFPFPYPRWLSAQ